MPDLWLLRTILSSHAEESRCPVHFASAIEAEPDMHKSIREGPMRTTERTFSVTPC